MGGSRVATFEAKDGGARRLSGHLTLAEASAALPDGAYTTLRTYEGRRVLRLEAHLARLEESAALQGLPGRIERRCARAAIAAALDATRHPESRLRLSFTAPRLFVAVEAFRALPPALYAAGVSCVTLEMERENPHAKDTRFIATAQHAYGRLPPGVEEALLVAGDGSMLEGLSSNFFAVEDGVLRSEGERVLRGITRALVLEVARGVLSVRTTAIRREDLPRIAEAFVTSVSREVLPVVRIDEVPVGDGRVGPKTREVMTGFAALVAREAERL